MFVAVLQIQTMYFIWQWQCNAYIVLKLGEQKQISKIWTSRLAAMQVRVTTLNSNGSTQDLKSANYLW
jgi:hypothetical protein